MSVRSCRPSSSPAFWCIAVCISAMLAFVPALAHADEYSPPAGLVEPSLPAPVPTCPLATALGEEPKESAELEYSEQSFSSSVCEALSYRLDRLRERSYWTAAELAEARKLEKELLITVEGLSPAKCTEHCSEGSEAVVAALKENDATITEQGELILEGIFIMVGVVIGVFVLGLLRRVLDNAG